MNALCSNNDLIWDFDEFRNRQMAADFVKRFENKLCVYSGSVGQLYSNYNIFFPRDEAAKMVILPDPYAYHDTFQGVPEDAIRVTGMTIVPGEMFGKVGLYLTIPFRSDRGQKTRVVPLQAGLRAITARQPEDKPFLPILMKGDLREFQNRVPTLHLHTIQLDRLVCRSQMERNGIRRVIAEKLPSIS